MKEGPVDAPDTGRLLERGFYIEPRDYTMLTVLSITVAFFFIIQMTAFIAILSGMFKNGYWFIALCTMPILMFLLGLAGETRYAFRLRNGDLDWDLYENGMMIKKWNVYNPSHNGDVILVEGRPSRSRKKLEERLVRFDSIARVYLNKDDKNKDRCFGLYLRHLNKGSPPDRPYIKDEDSLERDMIKRYIPAAIFLEDRDGELPVNPIDWKNIRDISRFEEVLRQKVNSVQ